MSKFLEAGLVDDITISVIATVLGSGIPLFGLIHFFAHIGESVAAAAALY